MAEASLLATSANSILALLLLAIGVASFCAWRTPQYLRRLAAKMLARAEALEAYKYMYKATEAEWRMDFEVGGKIDVITIRKDAA